MKTLTFEGEEYTVEWDGKLCMHAEECWRSDSTLFELKRKPFGDPDQVDGDEIDRVAKRCPSGSISWQDKSGQTEEEAASSNTVTIVPAGPAYIRGDLSYEGIESTPGATHRRAALCRCGQSQNKPFCDNSHKKEGWDDTGAVGREGPGFETEGGQLTVSVRKDGPVLLRGNVSIRAASGEIRWQGQKVSLCRCGLSSKKPFCDGSHKGQFEADGVS